MKFLQQLFLYLGFLAVIFFIVGLYKPWIMLWWEDVQNRRKVIRLYGTIMIISFSIYFITGLISKANP